MHETSGSHRRYMSEKSKRKRSHRLASIPLQRRQSDACFESSVDSRSECDKLFGTSHKTFTQERESDAPECYCSSA